MRVLLLSLGCKVNQADSEGLRALLERNGASVTFSWDEPIDAVLVNSCAVTAAAEQDCRKLVRRARRAFPAARIALLGCAPQVNEGLRDELPEADACFGTTDKEGIAAWLLGATPRATDERAAPLRPLARPDRPARVRPPLLVQQGCNAACAYCVVPRARGPERSLPAELVRHEIRGLAAAGAPEVVLVGIHLGRYGRGLDPAIDLAGLLELLLDEPGPRLRLSSLDPDEVNPRLAALFAHPRLCPHAHLALQSGDAAVLRTMNRPEAPAAMQRAVELLRAARPGLTLGADVLVGFPTEDAAAFENTFALCAELALSYLHVFPFSPRPGTPAAQLRPLAAGLVHERAARMRELGQQLRRAHLNSLIGRRAELVVERWSDRSGAVGTSEYYHQGICSQTGPIEPGALISGHVQGVNGRALLITRAAAD